MLIFVFICLMYRSLSLSFLNIYLHLYLYRHIFFIVDIFLNIPTLFLTYTIIFISVYMFDLCPSLYHCLYANIHLLFLYRFFIGTCFFILLIFS